MNRIKPIRSFMPNLMRTAQISLKSEHGGTSGSAGAIREAGGTFGKLGAAKEAQYFHKQQLEQLEQLKKLTHRDVTSKEFQGNGFEKFKKDK